MKRIKLNWHTALLFVGALALAAPELTSVADKMIQEGLPPWIGKVIGGLALLFTALGRIVVRVQPVVDAVEASSADDVTKPLPPKPSA